VSQIDKTFLGARSMAVFTSSSVTPASTPAGSTSEQAFTITGQPAPLLATDVVLVGSPGSGNALCLSGARANASGQLVLHFVNPTAGALTYPAGPLTVVIFRA
jgi:hypothetical protein